MYLVNDFSDRWQDTALLPLLARKYLLDNWHSIIDRNLREVGVEQRGARSMKLSGHEESIDWRNLHILEDEKRGEHLLVVGVLQ